MGMFAFNRARRLQQQATLTANNAASEQPKQDEELGNGNENTTDARSDNAASEQSKRTRNKQQPAN